MSDQELTEEIASEGGLLMGHDPWYANWRFLPLRDDFSRATPIFRILFAITLVILPAIGLIWFLVTYMMDTKEHMFVAVAFMVFALLLLAAGIKILLTSKRGKSLTSVWK